MGYSPWGRKESDITEQLQCFPGGSEEIKRWQEYTEELYKKGLNDLENHDNVITHLEPDTWSKSQEGLRKHHYQQS